MKYTVISGDIIASSSIDSKEKGILESQLQEFLSQLKADYDVFSRIIKGDYVECVIPNSGEALKIALAIKCFIKSLPIEKVLSEKEKNRFKAFKTYGIRLAIGYGELSRFDAQEGIIDGEAIYLSGRWITENSTHSKQRIVVKNTLQFLSNDDKLNRGFEPLLMLLDLTINKATSRQCQIAYLKLLGKSEEQIASDLSISQPVVNQHSTALGYNAIESAVNYFQYTITE